MAVVVGSRVAARERTLFYAAKCTSQVGINLLLAGLFVRAGTGSSPALDLSGLLLASLLPGILFGVAGGAVVDRLGAPRGYALGAALRLVPAIVGFAVLHDADSAWAIALISALTGLVFGPAEMAMVDVVQRDRPGRAHTILLVLQYGARGVAVVGIAPGLYFAGGPRLMLLGAAVAFALTVVVALVLARRLGRLPHATARSQRKAFSIRTTVRFFASEPLARYAVLALSIRNAVLRGMTVALPLFLQKDLGLGPAGLASLLSPGIVGAVIGLAWAARASSVRDASWMMRRSVVGLVVGVLALAVFDYGIRAVVALGSGDSLAHVEPTLNTTFAAALPASFLLGLSLAGSVIGPRVVLTATAPEGQQARVFATQDLLTESLLILPLVLTGIGTDVVGARPTLAAIAILCATALLVVRLPHAHILHHEQRALRAAPAEAGG